MIPLKGLSLPTPILHSEPSSCVAVWGGGGLGGTRGFRRNQCRGGLGGTREVLGGTKEVLGGTRGGLGGPREGG